MQFPIKKFSRIYHVGDMAAQPAPNSRSSYEGPCLSVSRTPNAWRQIAKLGDAPIWILRKPGARFLDMCRVPEGAWASVVAWGYEMGYAVPQLAWMTKVRETTENDEPVVKTYSYSTREQSVRELGEDGDEEVICRWAESAPFPTEKLHAYAEQDVCLGMTLDMLALAYAEHVLDLDGLYWDSEFDVYSCVAPRAGILRGKLSSWGISRAPAGFTTKEEEEEYY